MEKRPMRPDDLYAFRIPGEIQVSPDGKYTAYVVQNCDREKDETCTNIFLADNTTLTSKQLTFSGKDRSPCFSPDGKRLAFISTRSEKSQIWILDLSGGEAWCLKTKEAVLGDLVWTPDGKHLIYTADVFSHDRGSWTPYPGAPAYDRERLIKLADKPHRDKPESDQEKDPKVNEVKVITRFHYRHDGHGYFGHVRKQVFMTPVPDTPCPDWKPQSRQITHGDYDHGSPAISPDGKYIAVSARRTETADYDQKTDLWLFEIATGKEYLLYDAPGPCYNPTWSPCGRYIAFAGHDNRIGVSTSVDLWVLDVSRYLAALAKAVQEGKEDLPQPLTVTGAHNVTRPLDRPVGGQGSEIGSRGGTIFGWQENRLIFLLGNRGAGEIYQVVPYEAPQPILQRRDFSVASIAVSQKAVAFIASSPTQPDEVYLINDGNCRTSYTALTRHNGTLMEKFAVGNWEEFAYPSDDGQLINGWILYPAEFDPKKRYPLVLLIHGGPHAAYGPTFMLTGQLLTAQGYVVLYTNPRGSTTYGQEFACCIDKNWGDRDYADVMAGVDAVIHRGFIDESKMFVHGWSYGGYLACWILTQTPRFKAICAGASVTNMLSGYGTSDITFADEYEYGGQPWKDYEHLIKHSPLGHVENVTTPVLLMHGEEDLRVAPSQTEEFYTALKRLGKEAVMIRYPGEFHGPKRLIHRLDRYERLIAWFNYYRDL